MANFSETPLRSGQLRRGQRGGAEEYRGREKKLGGSRAISRQGKDVFCSRVVIFLFGLFRSFSQDIRRNRSQYVSAFSKWGVGLTCVTIPQSFTNSPIA